MGWDDEDAYAMEVREKLKGGFDFGAYKTGNFT